MYEVELLSKLVSYDTSVDTKKEYVKMCRVSCQASGIHRLKMRGA